MTQEDKELLFRDLCGRLPYGVKIEVTYSKDSGSSFRARHCYGGINTLDTSILWLFQQSEIYIKPYLIPLSSMTEEQKSFFDSKHIEIDDYLGIIALFSNVDCEEWDEVFCWLNKNHFDYRGLIPMELAKDATGLNIY